jgi:hypothetical protein
MSLTKNRSKLSLEELYGQAMFSTILTPSDRQKIKNILLGESLSASEMLIIDRLIYNVRQGWLQVTD